jgi:hypothetical protein
MFFLHHFCSLTNYVFFCGFFIISRYSRLLEILSYLEELPLIIWWNSVWKFSPKQKTITPWRNTNSSLSFFSLLGLDRAGLVNVLKVSRCIIWFYPIIWHRRFLLVFLDFQNKIQGLAGQQASLLEALSPSVRKRVSALQEIQVIES